MTSKPTESDKRWVSGNMLTTQRLLNTVIIEGEQTILSVEIEA